MSLPDKVKIGGIDYDISLIGPDNKQLEDGECWGIIDHENCEILISKELKKDKQKEILVHEILHGIVDFVELEEEISDDYISRLSKIFYQVLKDNDLNFNKY